MIDWDAVVQRAAAGHLTLALVWVARRLRTRGVDLPPLIPHPTANDRTRLRAVHVCAGLSERLNGRFRDYRRAAAAAILCGRPVALPRFILRYERLRAADFRARLLLDQGHQHRAAGLPQSHRVASCDTSRASDTAASALAPWLSTFSGGPRRGTALAQGSGR